MAEFKEGQRWIQTGSNIYNQNQTGGVAIGTTTATDDLTVSGTSSFTSNMMVNGSITISGGNAQFVLHNSTVPNLIFASGGNIGVNTSSPSQRLTISGGITEHIGDGAVLRITGIAGGTRYFNIGRALNGYDDGYLAFDSVENSNSGFQFGAGSSPRLTIKNNGDIGIGTTLPVSILDISGASPIETIQASITDTPAILDLRNNNLNGGINSGQLRFRGTDTVYGQIAGHIGDNVSGGFLTFQTRETNVLTERMRIGSGGQVGIGLTNPNAQLTLSGNALPMVIHGTGKSNSLFISGNGNIGINRNNPLVTLHVDGQVRLDNGQAFMATDNNEDRTIEINNDGSSSRIRSSYITTSPAQPITFLMGGEAIEEKMRISTNGNVGIGVTPSERFHVSGARSRLNQVMIGETETGFARVEGLGGGLRLMDASNNQNIYLTSGTTTLGSMYFQTNSATRMLIDGNGLIGVGLTNPNALLTLSGNALPLVIHGTGQANILFVSGNGNVGINNTNPLYDLHVYDSAAESAIFIQSDEEQNAVLYLGSNASSAVYRDGNQNNIKLYAGGADRLTVTSGGNVGIGTTTPGERLHVTTGSVPLRVDASGTVPTTAGTAFAAIGSPSAWMNINVSGTIYKIPLYLP